MMRTSTPALNLTKKKTEKTADDQIPEFAIPSAETIQAILNYGRNLEVKKSGFVSVIEYLRT
jgi:hypothetical protein